MRRLAPPALAVVLACGTESPGGLSTGPGVTSASLASTSTGEPSSSSTSGAESSSGSSTSGGSSGAPDMGPPPDFGDVQPAGCKGKIDFLFLIASDGTMQEEQEQLLGSLPGFIDAITSTFSDFDLHVMVANPEATWSGWVCETPEWCGKDGTCGPDAPGYECGPQNYDLITECDETIGAGLTFNAGGHATNHRCELYEGRRYITIPGEPDPAAAFDCIARVGTNGGDQLGEALVAAVSPELNALEFDPPQGCNAGFLRPDALLVVTFIMDSEDGDSKGTPADWYDAVIAAKGSPGSVVALAILSQPYEGPPPPGCVDDFLGKQRLRDLINMFPFHVEGDACAKSYVPFFEQAAGLVGEACGSFIPK